MSMLRRIVLPVVLLLLFSSTNDAAQAQSTDLNETARAVVRILPQRCGPVGCQAMGVGSGAIIHPGGVILTAWHVTVEDPNNTATPQYADDFIIEVTENVSRAPQPRYRAELIAVKPEMDLALLRIYQDLATNRPVALTADDLPVLSIAAEIPRFGQLQILGYPPAGNRSINYPTFGISSYAEDDALLTVQGTLSEGFSGGPALVAYNGKFEIVGVVIRRRGTLGEVGLIRSIDQLQDLDWFPNAPRAWAENPHVATVQDASGSPALHISADVNALDFGGRQGRLLAYIFSADTGQPWPSSNEALEKAANGQLVLRADFSAERFMAFQQSVDVTVPVAALGASPEQLRFRLLLWDADAARVLWKDAGWLRAEPLSEPVALAPTQTPAATPSAMPAPALTATPTQPPTATDTPVPTETSTVTPQPTATATHTPNIAATRTAEGRQVATSLAATLTARPTNTPRPTATPTPPPQPEAGATRTLPGTEITMVYVPAGEFLMGSTKAQIDAALDLCNTYYAEPTGNDCPRSWFEPEAPQHEVYVDAFWIMQTEVTNAHYAAFMAAGGYEHEDWWSADGWSWREENDITEPEYWQDNRFNASEQPVVGVSWYEAEAFANWLAVETELDVRLPTEAEWEKAARGTDGRTFPWGNEWDGTLVNYCDTNCEFDWKDAAVDDGYALTAPVGSYPQGASPYGAFDMAGNVWEWVADWYDAAYYADSPNSNPTGPDSGEYRVVRGGSWASIPDFVRAAIRDRNTSGNRLNLYLGVRVVWSPGL